MTNLVPIGTGPGRAGTFPRRIQVLRLLLTSCPSAQGKAMMLLGHLQGETGNVGVPQVLWQLPQVVLWGSEPSGRCLFCSWAKPSGGSGARSESRKVLLCLGLPKPWPSHHVSLCLRPPAGAVSYLTGLL